MKSTKLTSLVLTQVLTGGIRFLTLAVYNAQFTRASAYHFLLAALAQAVVHPRRFNPASPVGRLVLLCLMGA